MSSFELPFSRYRFHLQAESLIVLPPYSGSAWRGLFGTALRRVVCATGMPQCEACMLSQQCAYRYVFETEPAHAFPMQGMNMQQYQSIPHPYVIQPDPQQRREVRPGESLFFDLTLVAKANQHLPYIVYAIQQAGQKMGVGAKRGRFSVTSIEQWTTEGWTRIYLPDDALQTLPPSQLVVPALSGGSVALRFVTPFRTRIHNHYLRPEDFAFEHLFKPLLRRLSSLLSFYAGEDCSADFAELARQSCSVSLLKADLAWHDWTRYSSRQQSELKMGGLLGEIELEAAMLSPYWSALYLGQWLNVGKGTVMGLGCYELHEKPADVRKK